MFAVFRLMGIAWTIIERQDQAGQQHGLPSRADGSVLTATYGQNFVQCTI
jgi:hypothetical protein